MCSLGLVCVALCVVWDLIFLFHFFPSARISTIKYAHNKIINNTIFIRIIIFINNNKLIDYFIDYSFYHLYSLPGCYYQLMILSFSSFSSLFWKLQLSIMSKKLNTIQLHVYRQVLIIMKNYNNNGRVCTNFNKITLIILCVHKILLEQSKDFTKLLVYLTRILPHSQHPPSFLHSLVYEYSQLFQDRMED